MLKIKLIKTKNIFIFKIIIIDSKKMNSKNSKKIGILNKKFKIIHIKYKELKINILKGAKLSKGFKKTIKKKNYDIQILREN